jgi:hypothetical protein
MALRIITHRNQSEDFNGLLAGYCEHEEFNSSVFFGALLRIGEVRLVPNGIPANARVLALEAFARKDFVLKDWPLVVGFAEILIGELGDKAVDFLSHSKPPEEGRLGAVRAALDHKMFDLAEHFSKGDVHLSLLFAYRAHKWSQLVERLEGAFASGAYAPAAQFLTFADLSDCRAAHTETIVGAALSPPPPDMGLVGPVASAIFSWLPRRAEAWKTVVAKLIALPLLRPVERDVPFLERFIFQADDDEELITARVALLGWAVAGGVGREGAWCDLAAECDFGDSQNDAFTALAPLVKTPEKLSEWLWRQGATKFRGPMRQLGGGYNTRQVLLVKPKRWLCINASEFVELVAESGDPGFASELYKRLKTKPEMQWHFLSGLFQDTNFGPRVDRELRQDYLTLACRYAPERVRKIAKQFLEGAERGQLDMLLEIVKKNWIVDAVLVLYNLCDQVQEAANFAREAIHVALVERDEFGVVDDVLAFLTHPTKERDPIVWIACMEAFQLPVYARLTRRPEALPEMLEVVGRFLQAMVAFKPSRVNDWLRRIASEFCRTFAFLPMQYGRDLIKKVFKEMRDRSDFFASVAQIGKDALLEREKRWFETQISPQTVDTSRCTAPSCGLLHGAEKAIVFSRDKVVHERCLTAVRESGEPPYESSLAAEAAPPGKLRWAAAPRLSSDPPLEIGRPVAKLGPV